MKPWLWLPPQLAHDLSPYGLKIVNALTKASSNSWLSFNWKTSNKNIFFPNRLGIAGGVDKNAVSVLDWQKLGCGFIEIGTVTPRAQGPNPGKIMDRDLKTQSLWNKMGFPSMGSEHVSQNMKALKQNPHLNIPLFINLGKNRDTPQEKAQLDYMQLMTDFQNLAEAFVINISSPNTSGLRDLVKPEVLGSFVNSLVRHRETLTHKLPLIIKFSPDLETHAFSEAIRTCLNYDIDGFIFTNTTLNRAETPFYPEQGGVSGRPLQTLSKKFLSIAAEICAQEKTKKLIISTGGVMTAADVFERIECGADLVQVYSALVFEGPLFFRKVAKVAAQKPALQYYTHSGSSTGA